MKGNFLQLQLFYHKIPKKTGQTHSDNPYLKDIRKIKIE